MKFYASMEKLSKYFKLFCFIPLILTSSLLSCKPAAQQQEAEIKAIRLEPFAGDIENNSPYLIRVWGDNLPDADSKGYACFDSYSNSHVLPGAVDIDFAYSASRRQWCKIGPGVVKISADGKWECPLGWSNPGFLRDSDLGC